MSTALSEDYQDIVVSIGQRIREIRESKGLSQLDIAVLCDSDKTAISRIEAGRTNATIKTFIKISKALDVSLSEMFDIN
ncbi:MAG: helix-turn-helix transcriptional regulator [Chitinophagales bacterium]